MNYKIILIFFIIIASSGMASAQLTTSLSMYDDGQDNSSYTSEWTKFYANYSSDDGYNLGQVLYRNPTDLGTSYSVTAFDPAGTGNKTAIAFSESDNIRAHYANGTEIWNSYNSQFDYAYNMFSGDFNNDSFEEIAFVSSHGELFVLNGSDGSVLYESTDYYTGYSMEYGDIDDDGLQDDFVMGVRDVNGATGNNYGIVVFIYNNTLGNFSVSWTQSGTAGAIRDVAISEVTGTNLVGWVNDGGGRVYVYYADGTLKWNSGDRGNSYSLDFYDQDEDGEEDEVIMGENSELRVFDEDGVESSKTDPYGGECVSQKIDLDEDGIYDDILIGSNYHTLHAYNSDLTLAWTFKAPAKGFESVYYSSYFNNIKVADVNNDSSEEIIIGGFGKRYFILNLSGDIIGKHYYGDEENINDNDYIGVVYGKSPGIAIMNDTNGDGLPEIVSNRISGYFYVGQQVLCKIDIDGNEEYMYYNYSSSLWEYSHRFSKSGFNMTTYDIQNLTWNVTCEKGGYETEELSYNITVSPRNSSLDIFDQENDDEDNAGWLSEEVIAANETTYFFANYTDLAGNDTIRDLFIDTDYYQDFGLGYGLYDVATLDTDGDGLEDGFVYVSRDYINAYSFDGTLIWSKYDTTYEYMYNLRTGDFNNDSIEEVAAISSSGFLIVLNSSGSEIFRSDDYYTGYILESGDFNSDGVDELLIGVRDVNAGTGNNYGIVAFVYDTTISNFSENWTSNDATAVPAEIKVSEISGEENLVAYVDYNGADDIIAYYGNGSKKCQSSDLSSYVSTIEFIDYDGDGKKDEFLVGENGETYIYNEDCSRNRTDSTPSTSLVYEIREIDTDDNASTSEYVFFDRYDLYLMNSSGDQVWNYRLEDSLYGMIDVIDVDDDGIEEILFAGYDGILHILNHSGDIVHRTNLLEDSQLAIGEYARVGISYYGWGGGFELANETETASYMGIAVDTAYVTGGDIYPRCIIRFNDSTTARMSYNSSEELYYYSRNFSSAGAYTWNVTCESANHVTKTAASTINPNTPPTYETITNSPDEPDDLDPNRTITVTANISDINLNFDTAILQWKNSSDDWSNVTMTNTTTKEDVQYIIVDASFTPPYATEDNHTYRIWANDTEGVARFSTNTTLQIFWDCTWNVTSDLGAIAGWDQNKYISNLSINNTGDSEHSSGCNLDFRLTHSLAEGRIYFDDSYYKPSSTYSVAPKDNQTISLNATFGTDVIQEDATITTTDLTGYSESSGGSTILTLVSNQAGPYLYQEIRNSPTNIDLTETNFNLEGYLRNLMGSSTINPNNTAYNVSFNWTLPSGLTNSTGNLTVSFENITDNNLHYNNVNITFEDLESMTPGVKTVYLYAWGSNLSGDIITDANGNSILTETANITFSCYNTSDSVCVSFCGYTQDPDCSLPETAGSSSGSGGGASGGGGSGKATQYETSEDYFELLRGEQQKFELEITNKLPSIKENISIEVSGINADYISITPTYIREIASKSSHKINVTITAPAYFTKGEYELLFSINGLLNVNKSSNKAHDFSEKKMVKLFIVEVTRENADRMLSESKKMMEAMNKSHMVLKKIIPMHKKSLESYEKVDFLNVEENYKLIKNIHDAAFESMKIIGDLKEKIAEAEKNGIGTIETQKLLFLAEAAFKRGEYILTLERLEETQLTYALETKGEFNLFYAVKNNPLETTGILMGFAMFSLATSLALRYKIYKRKLRLLKDEEKLLFELMKIVQIECFDKNKMSMEEYQEAMDQYTKKLSNSIEEKINIETKLSNMLKRKGKKNALKDEKTRIISLMKELQEDYLNKGKIETRLYENNIKTYSKKLSDVEGDLTFLEAKEALKANRFIKRLFRRKKK
jgi:hypothetical protein